MVMRNAGANQAYIAALGDDGYFLLMTDLYDSSDFIGRREPETKKAHSPKYNPRSSLICISSMAGSLLHPLSPVMALICAIASAPGGDCCVDNHGEISLGAIIEYPKDCL